MRVINSTEFAAHQDKYFDLALKDNICIQKGQKKFYLTYEPAVAEQPEQPVLEPDDNLRRAISAEEFKKNALEIVEKAHRKFYGNKRQICPRNA